jgi:beta-galactosidase
MMNRFPPINPKFPHLLHGGDYNPDQWIRTPEIWDEDMRLMRLARCNAMSVAIFSWSSLEPQQDKFEFGWLDTVMDKLSASGLYVVLATPSGSKPPWLSAAYPEVCRVRADGTREPHAYRHNHCRTSPIYRDRCVRINTELAQRYKEHPALLVWHVSNEYNGGECFCEPCLAAFRTWLRARYDDDLDKLNHAWWTGFWSHSFTDWDQILPVDHSIHGMMLDWRRFLTFQTIDFFQAESAPLRDITPDVPITTNFMGLSPTLNYWEFARELDVVSWDSYPRWHDTGDDVSVAVETAFTHDINRSFRSGQPFMLMESVPSFPTRRDVRKRKRPGMHLLSSLQAVAHGSDTVQYFQWRKGRGGVEKLHGAVVDHCGHENTRVFRDVAQLGQALEQLDGVVATGRTAGLLKALSDWETMSSTPRPASLIIVPFGSAAFPLT